MTEKLIVHNFAGIKELEIEIKKINILIGPQASGKSVCAKLLFYFKNFIWEILSAVQQGQTKNRLDLNYSKTFEEYFPPESWGNYDFYIRYEIANVFIEVGRKPESKTRGKGSVRLYYSEFFAREFTSLKKLLRKLEGKSLDNSSYERRIHRIYYVTNILEDAFSETLNASLGEKAAFAQIFIPAGRSFFANLQSSIFSFLSSNNALDPFLKTFGSTYENIKSMKLRSVRRIDERKEAKEMQDEINQLIEKSLCGKHIHEKGKDFLALLYLW